MSKMFDYITKGGDKVAELEASLEHMGGHLEIELEEADKLRAEIAKLKAALLEARDKLRKYGSWDEPSAMLLDDLADEIDEVLTNEQQRQRCAECDCGDEPCNWIEQLGEGDAKS